MADTLPVLLPRPAAGGEWKRIPAPRFYALAAGVGMPPSTVNRGLGYTEWHTVGPDGLVPCLARVLEGVYAGFYEWIKEGNRE